MDELGPSGLPFGGVGVADVADFVVVGVAIIESLAS